jgi:succinate dehydrogenase / fumarate reductase, iron-sulfur subunit
MLVKVFRFDPERDGEPRLQSYDVPVVETERWTAMDVLDYISRHLDGSLAYLSHSVCRQGVCGRCTVKVNGKAVLACAHVVEGRELVLEPAGTPVARDLVHVKERI